MTFLGMYAKSGVDLNLMTNSSPSRPFTVFSPDTTLSQDSLLFEHTLDSLFGLPGDTHVNVDFS